MRFAERIKHLKTIDDEFELQREYLLTVKEGTDELGQRLKREQILDGLLRTLFEKKDRNRTFSTAQRRIIWHSTDERRCSSCSEALTWDDFTIDHKMPYAKGGPTALSNAALMCRECNSKKGSRLPTRSVTRVQRRRPRDRRPAKQRDRAALGA